MTRSNLLFCWFVTTCFSGSAATVHLATSNTNPQSTTDLTGFTTLGSGMDGMRVTATFADGFTELATWARTGSSSGGAIGSNWTLREQGDTFGSAWALSHARASGLVGLFFDAGTGGTIFDVNFDSGVIRPGESTLMGTPNSARGWSFDTT